MVVPSAVTDAVMAVELPAITAWAARRGWDVDVDVKCRTVAAKTVHPKSGAVIVFHADLDEYPAIPPAWTCRDADGVVSLAAFPRPGQQPGVSGSIFHTNNVICAPWNRLAYAANGGPHGDWEDLTAWKNAAAGAGYTQAHTIPDMLNTIRLHLVVSPGTVQ